jgi:outer membrane protein OmpA-like peptidoglycan-associated protein
MKTVLIFVYCLGSFAAFGQISKIQWASSLEFQFNQYQEELYSASRAVGPPDAFPPGRINTNAFRLKSAQEFGNIKLGLSRPQHVNKVIIVENNDPGRITEVKLWDVSGLSYIIYQHDPFKARENFRTTVLSIPKTTYLVKSIEIKMNSIPAPGYCQIDAVGVLSDANMLDVRAILSGANFNVQQLMNFTSTKTSLKGHINSRYIEAKPLVSHDGNTLYFSRLFHPDNTGGKLDPQDIYTSKYINGEWTEAENFGFPLNDEYANGVCSISPDGNMLLVINGYASDGTVEAGVSLSKRTSQGWSKPQKLDIVGFENQSKFQDFFLSADQRVIIMAVERKEGYGDQDLYVSLKIGENRYSRPINLGVNINTYKAEFAPFLSADNTTLYFASDGHGGYGESDIFKTKRLDESWKRWSKPQNLGPAVNTSSWEAYFSITASGDYAYFVSSEGSRKGQENIFKIPLLQDVTPELPDELIAFQGRTFDALTNKPISANVVLKNVHKERPFRAVSDDLTGNFLFYVPKAKQYEFTVKAPGYITFFENVNVEPFEQDEKIYRNIYLTPIASEQIFTLSNLLFERSKPVLLEDSYPALEKLARILHENPSMKIELAGHTDALGSFKAKQTLSFERVERVKDILVEYGIDKRRIVTIGYGGSKPIAPNDIEENRAKNRRVEIKVLDIGT